MRLIDADDYKERLSERIECQGLKSFENCIHHDIEILDGMPTVDAIPLINMVHLTRCKECRKYEIHYECGICDEFHCQMPEDGFCSKGVMK